MDFNSEHKSDNDIRAVRNAAKILPTPVYRQPTEVCKGYLKEIVSHWEQLGLFPCRVRFRFLDSGGSCPFHRDYPVGLYAVRLHVPVLTNANCFYEVENEGSVHMAADGSGYLIDVTKRHRVSNHGNTQRVHLIADVYDTNGISKFHKLTPQQKETLDAGLARQLSE